MGTCASMGQETLLDIPRKLGGSRASTERSVRERYEIQSQIGRGARSTVYHAYDKIKHMDVALKCIEISCYGLGNIDDIQHEIDLCASIEHDRIVRIHRVMETDEHVYIAYEYALHGDLHLGTESDLAERIELARFTARHIGLALRFLHAEAIVHRDVKLGNILWCKPRVLKLCDFNMAERCEDKERKRCAPGDRLLGTFEYMAPEYMQTFVSTPSNDMWALGVTLYALIAREFPYDSELVRKRKPEAFQQPPAYDPCIWNSVPRSLTKIVQYLLEPDPVCRWTARDVTCDEWVFDKLRRHAKM